MDDFQYLYTISGVIYIFAQLLLVISSLLLFKKTKSMGTILFLIGSVLNVVLSFSAYFIALVPLNNMDNFMMYQALNNIFSGLAFCTCCIGVFLFVILDLKKLLANERDTINKIEGVKN